MPKGQSRGIDVTATKNAMRLANPLGNALTIPQDVAQAINLQLSSPKRQLAEQQAYNQAQQLTDQSGQTDNPEDQLNLLKRAQAIYTQQGQQAQQNRQGFSSNIHQQPAERGLKSAAEIVSAAAMANFLASGIAGAATEGATKAASTLPKDYGNMTIGQLQEMHQAQTGVAPLAELDQAMRGKDYAGVIAAAGKILRAESGPLTKYQQSLQPYTEPAYRALSGK